MPHRSYASRLARRAVIGLLYWPTVGIVKALIPGLLGVVVGFGLKALYDLLMENRRWQREDRLRFINEKQRVYAELGALTLGIRTLVGDLAESRTRRAEAAEELKRMREKVNRGVLLDEDEQADVTSELEHLQSEVAALEESWRERQHELHHVIGVLTLLAPEDVEDAADALVKASGPKTSTDEFDDSHVAFRHAAGRDIGARR